jgi:hypothetical protein
VITGSGFLKAESDGNQMKCSSFKVLAVALFVCAFAAYTFAGDGSACDKNFSSDVLPTPQQVGDVTEHFDGQHLVTLGPFGRCTYSGPIGVPCNVNTQTAANDFVAESGHLNGVGKVHSPAGNYTLGSASGISPQSAATNMIEGVVSCIGNCPTETVTGGPPWTISPGPWLYSKQGTWTNNCPYAKVGKINNCSRIGGHVIQPPLKCENGDNCQCNQGSPILIDTRGTGYQLGPLTDCVNFDLGDGTVRCYSWPVAGSGNGWLALDRNHNGKIDNGLELFGNYTDQQDSKMANGFIALEEFDKPENGGNLDNQIDQNDAIYPQLLVWIDENHDGISQPNELHKLSDLGIRSISTIAEHDDKVDQYGNDFRYTAPILLQNSPAVTLRAYDIFLTPKK